MSAAHRRAVPARGGVAGTAPWRRAPLLLLRQPAVFLAIVGATAILAIAAASGPLFLSTIGTASLHSQAEQRCPETGSPTVNAAVSGTDVSAAARQGEQAFARNGLTSSYHSADGYATVQASLVHLFSRTGALDHVRKLTPAAGSGVWLPNVFAQKIHARPGDTITTAGGKPLRVAGIYQDLAPDPYVLANLPRYWCSFSNQIVSTVASDAAIGATAPQFRQGPLIIADDATVASASEADVQPAWTAPMSSVTHPLADFDAAVTRAKHAADDLSDFGATPARLADLTAAAHTSRTASPARSCPSRSPGDRGRPAGRRRGHVLGDRTEARDPAARRTRRGGAAGR